MSNCTVGTVNRATTYAEPQEIIRITPISRATLSNYVALGILPKSREQDVWQE